MTPRLFAEDATTYTTNGLGPLTEAISCQVTEELNGIYELELQYPITGQMFSALQNSALIVCEPHEGGNEQAFRIYKITKPMNGRVTVYAQHISYQLNWIPVMPFNYSSLADCLAKLKTYSASTNPFTLWTNKSVSNGHSFDIPQSFRACLGGVEGSVLQMYGGDYEWDNYTVKLWLRRGVDNGVRIAYGKNLIDAKQEANIEATYTGVCPFWRDEETGTLVTLPEKYILASTASSYPYSRIKTVDFSSDFENEPSVAQLRARTNQYITANNIGYPNISIDVNFVALWQSEEYKGIAPLEQVQLGDTVTIDIEQLGISTSARVEKYTYDVLKNRYSTITIGDAKSSFAKTFVNQGKAIETSLGEAKAYTGKAVAAAKTYSTDYTDGEVADALREAEATAQELMENATNWLTSSGGYVVAVKNTDGSWKELLFLDTPSTSSARKVLRINENGMGFSSTGVNGPYKQAWTLDGKLVVGGTDAVTISAVNGSNQEIFGVNSQGISWLLKTSLMTKNGTLYFLGAGATASSGNVLRLNSGGISFSKNGYNGSYTQAWNINGKLMVGGTDAVVISAIDGTSHEIFNVNKDGISWTMAQSIMKKNGTLYFLGNGATANSGKVLRLNNLGISFSKNGYNGTYTQSWTIDGELTIGGQGNKYGSFTLVDSAGNVICEMNRNGIDFYGYNGNTESHSAWIKGNGFYTVDNSTDEDTTVYPGGIDFTNEDGEGASYRGDGFNVVGTSAYYDDDEDVGVLEAGEVRAQTATVGTIVADTVNAGAIVVDGGSSSGITVSDMVLPGDYHLTFENGILTSYTRGWRPLEGEVQIPCEGDTLIYMDGILYDLESLSDWDDDE